MIKERKVLQLFEGYIDTLDLETNQCTVVLYDKTDTNNPKEWAEIDLDKMERNVTDIKEGYIFEWSIGHQINEKGEIVSNFSFFEFKKRTNKEIAAFNKNIKRAKKKANKIYHNIQKHLIFD